MTKQEAERLAHAKIIKARAEIVMTRKFYAVLIANVDVKPCWSISTMGTDSKTHYYNPMFINGLPQSKIVGTCVHESEHDARHHSTRRNGRDPERWNKACDYAINGDIIAQGFELPDNILFRKEFVGLGAENIYRILEIEEQKKKEEEEKQRQQQQQPEESEDEEDSESKPSDDEADSDDADDSDSSEDESEDEGGDDEDGESDDEGNGESDAGDDAGEDGDGDGKAEADDESGDDASGSGSGNDADDETDGDGESRPDPVSVGDAGGCGEVFDAPGDDSEQADLDARWEVVTRRAAALAKKGDDMPGHWTTIIEERATPTEDWRAVLREYIDAGAQVIQTFNRPNKRFVHSGTILPGNQKDGVNKVCFLVDTSGSMWTYLQNASVSNEVKAAFDAGLISEAIVIHCDRKIHQIDRYVDGDEFSLEPKGLGDTDMRPGFQWIEENEPDTSLIVCLTDLYIGDPGPEPACPTLWCAYGDPRVVKALGAALPFGKVLDVGAN